MKHRDSITAQSASDHVGWKAQNETLTQRIHRSGFSRLTARDQRAVVRRALRKLVRDHVNSSSDPDNRLDIRALKTAARTIISTPGFEDTVEHPLDEGQGLDPNSPKEVSLAEKVISGAYKIADTLIQKHPPKRAVLDLLQDEEE